MVNPSMSSSNSTRATALRGAVLPAASWEGKSLACPAGPITMASANTTLSPCSQSQPAAPSKLSFPPCRSALAVEMQQRVKIAFALNVTCDEPIAPLDDWPEGDGKREQAVVADQQIVACAAGYGVFRAETRHFVQQLIELDERSEALPGEGSRCERALIQQGADHDGSHYHLAVADQNGRIVARSQLIVSAMNAERAQQVLHLN